MSIYTDKDKTLPVVCNLNNHKLFSAKPLSGCNGPFKCYVTLFSGNFAPTDPHVRLIMLNGAPFYCSLF